MIFGGSKRLLGDGRDRVGWETGLEKEATLVEVLEREKRERKESGD